MRRKRRDVRSLLESLARRLLRRAIRDGLIGGNVTWIVVGAFALALRLFLRSEPALVIREELRLGEAITVTHVPPPNDPGSSRRIRRRGRE